MRKIRDLIVSEFAKWLSLPDYFAVEVVMSTVIANRLPGEPLWLAIVGPSSSGKTEIVRSLSGLRRTHSVDKFTKSTFASGFRTDDNDPKINGEGTLAEYGLLSKMQDGKPHILIIEDFSSVFGKSSDQKSEIMSDLRRVYDGKYEVPFGNGVNVLWKGKMGLIACSTGQYDTEMGAQSKFGDRFLVYRNLPGDPVAVAEKAGRNSEETDRMRLQIQEVVSKMDKLRIPSKSLDLPLPVRSLIARLCAFVARCRTQVPRDNYTREIIGVPEIEGTARMSAQLHQLLRGIIIFRQIKQVTEAEIQVVESVAMSTIPSLRMSIILQTDYENGTTAEDLMATTGIPKTVLYRTLRDMQMLKLVEWFHQERPRDSTKGKYYAVKEYAGFFKQAQLMSKGGTE